MSFSSRNSNERISEGPKYYESIAQGEQSVKDEFYYNRMEEHLEFMEREFKLSLLWQRELMKQIKSTKNIDQEPCTRRNKELHTIHINSQEQYMLRKLLKRYCQINNDQLKTSELIRLATLISKSRESRTQNSISYVNLPPKQSLSQKRIKISKNNSLVENEIYEVAHNQLKSKLIEQKEQRESLQNEFGHETSHFKDLHQNYKNTNKYSQQASLSYSQSHKDPQTNYHHNQCLDFIISDRSQQLNNRAYMPPNEQENEYKAYQAKAILDSNKKQPNFKDINLDYLSKYVGSYELMTPESSVDKEDRYQAVKLKCLSQV